MEIKLAILSIGIILLISYLVFINRREKSAIKQQSFHSQSPKPDISTPSTEVPSRSNGEELDSFLEKRKLEIFREILRRDHIAKQKRQINKASCLLEVLEKLLGSQGAVEIFNYYGSVELFSDAYKSFLGHIPDEIVLKCFDDNQLWETKIEIYEKVKQAILDGSLKTVEEPKESDIWIVSIHSDSFKQWLQANKESIETLLSKIGKNFPSSEQLSKTHQN